MSGLDNQVKTLHLYLEQVAQDNDEVQKRFQRVIATIVAYKKTLMSLTNCILSSLGKSRMQESHDPPEHLTDNMYRMALAAIDTFNDAVSSSSNTTESWRIKKKALEDLERFLKENLAVDPQQFQLTDRQNDKALSKDELWFKWDGTRWSKKKWTTLCTDSGDGREGNVSVFRKSHSAFKAFVLKAMRKG